LTGQAYEGRTKLDVLLGDLLDDIQGRLVIDLGCGDGHETIELARRGAARVIGVDINLECLERARRNTQDAGLSNLIEFSTDAGCPADIVVSLDSFEHFAEPEAMLEHIHGLLRPGGAVISSFGPTWYHPFGGHLFSVFPWAHLIFSETALCRWRADFKTDGARRFHEVAGGLNQMTIARFERIARSAGLRVVWRRLIPIRAARWLHCRLTREFLTTVAQYELSPPPKA
jgi:SAM-dependent methyltransferase